MDVPEGAPYALTVQKNILHYVANGVWYAWSGANPVKVQHLPGSDTEFGTSNIYSINYPNTMAVRNGILCLAYPSETNSTTIEHGIYSYGARDKNYNESFGFSYTMSTGTMKNGTLRIGCIKSFGDKMFMSWRDGTAYGIDLISPASAPAATATWESLALDDGDPSKEKLACEVLIDFTALPTGCTITPKYKVNRGSWVSGTAATEGATQSRLNINKRYKELQVGFDVVCTTTTPVIYGVTIIRDLVQRERD